MTRVGLIGFGYWGPNLARNIAETVGLELTAIVDGRRERLELAGRRYPWTLRLPDAADVIARDDIDAVVIATPVSTHVPMAEAAIASGKHVLIEKPLAPTSAEGERLAELAMQRGVCLMVDHTFVYTGAVQKMRAIVDSGELGTMLYLDAVRVNLGLFQHDTNVIWDLAPHDLAIVDYLIDERPIAISA